MTRPYGKIPRSGHNKQPAVSAEILIKIAGRHTLEQVSLELQKAIAQLQEHDVYGVQMVRMRLETLDKHGEPIALWKANGKPVQVLHIPEEEAVPTYRL